MRRQQRPPGRSVRIAVVPRVAQQEERVPRKDLLQLPDRLRGEIMDYLNPRRLLTAQVELTAPAYTWVSVEVDARQRKRADRDEVREAIERRLYRYVNPVYGGPDGTGFPFDGRSTSPRSRPWCSTWRA